MALIQHPATGFPVGDPEVSPFEGGKIPRAAELRAAAGGLILSASGFRKVFAAAAPAGDDAGGTAGAPRASWAPPPKPGSEGQPDEDSLSPRLSPADVFVAGAMAKAFLDYLKARTGRADPVIILGIDARPTGPAIADAMCRIFMGGGARVHYLFIVSAPEVMAFARHCGRKDPADEDYADAFCYVSASHNPPAHNGVKFGMAREGGVLPGAEAAKLIEGFKATVADDDIVRHLLYAAEEADTRELARVYSQVAAWKRRSISAYTLFSREVVTGSEDPEAQERFLDAMCRGSAKAPVGVVAEFNGSARALSIDGDFLAGAGVGFRALNAQPRAFVHRIVPEGESLEPCCRALEAAHAEDPAFVAGYVPDCDGDRGNLVLWDGATRRGRVLAAQEVFALCCVAESAQLMREGSLSHDASGKPSRRVAIAVNDGTSMRIEAIGRAFGVEVHRAETGEANVVGLAERLRAEGAIVRILGEGSNGGNITYPSAVRDPLATLGALLKLLLLRDEESGARGLFRIWLERTGRGADYRDDFGIADVIASLPAFSTTSAFEPVAALKIATMDHAKLKSAYQGLFTAAFGRDRAEFARRIGVASWKAFASKGSGQSEVGEDFAASGKGGLRIALQDEAGRDRAFVWMRGSGTEPVFRVMADVDAAAPACAAAADPRAAAAAAEAWLIDWHRNLVMEADRRCAAAG